ELDDNLQQAIERYLGRPIAQDADVVGRLTVQSDPNHTPAEERGETYAMDGEAILWAGPVKIEQFGDEGDEHMRCSRALRHYPHATQAAALRRNLLATMDSVKCLSDYDDTAAGAPENPPDQPA
ncbi:MAG: hypothetical protein JWQ03_934, partial [Variovorax sp.]|nr:hypothetical protein [Variovorax sp.]